MPIVSLPFPIIRTEEKTETPPNSKDGPNPTIDLPSAGQSHVTAPAVNADGNQERGVGAWVVGSFEWDASGTYFNANQNGARRSTSCAQFNSTAIDRFKLSGDLTNLPEGSIELRNAHTSLMNIRSAIARAQPGFSPR
jgi:hypothetical protein